MNILKRVGIYLIVTVLSVTLITVGEARATIDCSNKAVVEAFRDYNERNSNPFIEFCEDGSSSCSAGPGDLSAPAPTSLEGDSNAHKVWNYFMARGLTPMAAAGAMGNIEQESSFDPWIGESGSTSIDKGELLVGFGLIQWTNTDGNAQGRRYGVMKYMEDNGVSLNATDPSQLDNALLYQLNYLWDQEYGSMTWQEPLNAEKAIEGDTSIETSADNTGNGTALLFHSLVERSADGALGKQERIDSAQKFLTEFGEGGSGGEGCSIGEGGLTVEQAQRIMAYYRDNETVDTIRALFDKPGSSAAGFFLGSGDALCGAGDGVAPEKQDLMSRLANCTAFSTYFVAKYTEMNVDGWGHGSDKAQTISAINPGSTMGDTPQVFAVFSRLSGEFGHTGIILGIEGDKLIIGEAACGAGIGGIAVRESTVAEMSGSDYQYVYTTGKVNEAALLEIANG